MSGGVAAPRRAAWPLPPPSGYRWKTEAQGVFSFIYPCPHPLNSPNLNCLCVGGARDICRYKCKSLMCLQYISFLGNSILPFPFCIINLGAFTLGRLKRSSTWPCCWKKSQQEEKKFCLLPIASGNPILFSLIIMSYLGHILQRSPVRCLDFKVMDTSYEQNPHPPDPLSFCWSSYLPTQNPGNTI